MSTFSFQSCLLVAPRALCGAALLFSLGCGSPTLDSTSEVEPAQALYTEAASCTAPACGTVLATIDGVSAYSNGSKMGTGVGCVDPKQTFDIQYQCAEFAKRYWNKAKGVLITGFARACDMCKLSSAKWTKYTGTSYTPKSGDLFVLPCATGTPYGHVGVVESVSPDGQDVSIIEQNWSCTGRQTFKRGRAACILSIP